MLGFYLIQESQRWEHHLASSSRYPCLYVLVHVFPRLHENYTADGDRLASGEALAVAIGVIVREDRNREMPSASQHERPEVVGSGGRGASQQVGALWSLW